ncbi:hypothetical protein [Mesobacillus stamsii]|uniref:Zn-ribbon and HTH transcriptional regulator n=1 Tax=Mesobacillus stamsii TaxID=225347 RepID=A0ABU0FXZ5_9BACI|nr:hypothetical protein [Mesobacillus stamsii]MDQ0414204.1 putative Zn-ribbon and HTH transcriptional regulator [Mesobacillus stamsii]
MTKNKYFVYWCKDCDIDFLFRAIKKKNFKAHCPVCGDFIHTELVKHLWTDKHYVYHKQYSLEEDDILIECRNRKMPVAEIMKILDGRTDKSIYSRIRQLKDKGRIAR